MRGQSATGFTLIELLVVIAIIALLVAIILPVYGRLNRQHNQQLCLANLRAIGVALLQYREDYDAFPAAPRPDYLRPAAFAQPDVSAGLPFIKRPSFPAEIPAGWREWLPAPGPAPQSYDFQPVADPALVKVGNFGLATLFYSNLLGGTPKLQAQRRQYLRNSTEDAFHCPQAGRTDGVNKSANIAAEGDASRTFDPLWAGYNSYDATYNYDQFNNDILAFDAAIGYGDLNSKRQLKNPNPPADTVVCWCYWHREPPSVKYIVPEPVAGDVNRQTDIRGGRLDLALWVDGTVSVMHPTVMKSASGQQYWVPPFLYSQGNWRRP